MSLVLVFFFVFILFAAITNSHIFVVGICAYSSVISMMFNAFYYSNGTRSAIQQSSRCQYRMVLCVISIFVFWIRPIHKDLFLYFNFDSNLFLADVCRKLTPRFEFRLVVETIKNRYTNSNFKFNRFVNNHLLTKIKFENFNNGFAPIVENDRIQLTNSLPCPYRTCSYV